MSPGSNHSAQARVTLVDAHDLVAEAVGVALDSKGYRTKSISLDISRPTGVLGLLPDIIGSRPEVVLLELDLEAHRDGTQLVEPLTRHHIPVVVLTHSRNRARWGEALCLGAHTVLSKESTLTDLLQALNASTSTSPLHTQGERDSITAWQDEPPEIAAARARVARLTRREIEILTHLLAGRRTTDIACVEFVSEATVRTQIKSILAKFEVPSQLQAMTMTHLAVSAA